MNTAQKLFSPNRAGSIKQIPIDTSRFNAFIEQAKAVMAHRELPATSSLIRETKKDPIAQFESFVKQATPIVSKEIKTTLLTHRKRLANICRWLVPQSCDILTAAGLSRNEVRYTMLIAWMLWPEKRPDLALRLQKAWLKALGCDDISSGLAKAVKPRTELSTDGGRADMVLDYENFIVIVEAKMDTDEHVTPNDTWQTEGYPASVRRNLNRPQDHPCVMVFLTPDGREAYAKDAIVTTYEILTTVVAETVSPEEVSCEMLRWAYSVVITHLLTHTTPGGPDGIEAIRQYAGRRDVDFTTDQILKDLPFLGPLCRILRKGEYT
jgi:hypothetical protein